MKPAAQVHVAIGILSSFAGSKKPVAEILRDWGRKNRYAGSKDRAAISGIVFETLRKYKSSAYILDSDRPRSRVLGALWQAFDGDIERCAVLFDGSEYGPARLNEGEAHKLQNATFASAPLDIKADFPTWLKDELHASFGANTEKEMLSFGARAPLDIRVNEAINSRDVLAQSWQDLSPELMPYSHMGMRFRENDIFSRLPNLENRDEFTSGLFDIQDEASQICSLLTAASLDEGACLLDYCAGGGGKSLAVSSLRPDVEIIASDIDDSRMKPLKFRSQKAKSANISIKTQSDLSGSFDTVLVDAPCSGSGTWRRKPESKWRLSQTMLAERVKEQQHALLNARKYVKQGGFLIFATCSILEIENRAQIRQFLSEFSEFEELDWRTVWHKADGPSKAPVNAFGSESHSLQLTPASAGTDGFFVSILKRK